MMLKKKRGISVANLLEQWFLTTIYTLMTSPASKNPPKKTFSNQPKPNKTIKLFLALATKTIKALASGTDL